MIKITNIDIFLHIIEDLKAKNSYFQLLGNVNEYGSPVSVLGADNHKTRLTARIVALTSIGELFFEQSVKLTDESTVADLQNKLSSLQVLEADVHFNSDTNTITIR